MNMHPGTHQKPTEHFGSVTCTVLPLPHLTSHWLTIVTSTITNSMRAILNLIQLESSKAMLLLQDVKAKIESVCADDRLLQRLKMMLFLYIDNKSLEQTGGKKSMYSAHRCTHRKANTVFTRVSVAAWKCMIQHHLTSWQGLLFPPLSFCVGEWQAAPTCLQPPQATDALQHTCGQTGH